MRLAIPGSDRYCLRLAGRLARSKADPTASTNSVVETTKWNRRAERAYAQLVPRAVREPSLVHCATAVTVSVATGHP